MTASPDGQGLALADEIERLRKVPPYGSTPDDALYARAYNDACTDIAALRATDGAGREWKTTVRDRAELRTSARQGVWADPGWTVALLDDIKTALAKIAALEVKLTSK